MERTEKINEIIDLLSGDQKQDVIIFDTYNCNPGYYRHDGKTINEAELEELKRNSNKTIIFVQAGQRGLSGGAKVLNVTSKESAGKLKNFLTK